MCSTEDVAGLCTFTVPGLDQRPVTFRAFYYDPLDAEALQEAELECAERADGATWSGKAL